jgi:hypothetical protein
MTLSLLLPSVFSLGLAAISPEQPAKPQTVELHAGELTLVLGNEADHGAERTGYIGIWSLTSVHEATNVFVPRYAGWIQSRGRAADILDEYRRWVGTIR